MDDQLWCQQVRDIARDVDRISDLIRAAMESHRSGELDVEPPDTDSVHFTLVGILENARQLEQRVSALFETICSTPTGKLLAGRRLSREEYYLLRAMGLDFGSAYSAGISEVDDYEVFDMLCYEDEEQVCYINPGLRAKDQSPRTVGGGFGRAPEELRRSGLQADQMAFFNTYRPDLLERFQRD